MSDQLAFSRRTLGALIQYLKDGFAGHPDVASWWKSHIFPWHVVRAFEAVRWDWRYLWTIYDGVFHVVPPGHEPLQSRDYYARASDIVKQIAEVILKEGLSDCRGQPLDPSLNFHGAPLT
ncbi:MAG: hypothetical protein HY796_02115 [Elusimicrobia bacterium]|nr:hypothetical protein [Elusimicrobiota bacterium]